MSEWEPYGKHSTVPESHRQGIVLYGWRERMEVETERKGGGEMVKEGEESG